MSTLPLWLLIHKKDICISSCLLLFISRSLFLFHTLFLYISSSLVILISNSLSPLPRFPTLYISRYISSPSLYPHSLLPPLSPLLFISLLLPLPLPPFSLSLSLCLYLSLAPFVITTQIANKILLNLASPVSGYFSD